MPLFWTVFDTKGFFIPNGFYPELFLIRTILIPKGRFSEIRNKTFRIKNRSDQKTLWCQKILLNFKLLAGVKSDMFEMEKQS